MSTPYTVRQGDHLARIAARFRFRDPATIWDHADNAELRASRENPDVLAPGDVVMIPDPEGRREEAATGRRHTFVARGKPLALRLSLLDFRGEPIAGAEGELAIRAPGEVTTDGEGKLDADLEPTDDGATLSLPQATITLAIGHLAPVALRSGVRARLVNLGYLVGPIDVADGEEDDEERLALEDFQIDEGLDATGEIDDATRAALLAAHGC